MVYGINLKFIILFNKINVNLKKNIKLSPFKMPTI